MSIVEIVALELQNMAEQQPELADATPRPRGVDDLPDLTGRLIKDGLHDEYIQYRERYLRWRQGAASGAQGELAWLGTERNPRREDRQDMQDIWHPTPQKFDFFYTVSYWVAVVGLVGSMLLCISDISRVVAKEAILEKRTQLLAMISTTGDAFFTLSCYLSWFELINFPEDGLYIYLLPSNWASFRERVDPESKLGVLSYLLGMMVWDISSLATVMNLQLGTTLNLLLHKIPTLIGGFLFAVGGVCEVVHNNRRSWCELAWWTSAVDCVAGSLMAIGGVLGFLKNSFPGEICFALGMVLYLVGCVFLLFMWRGNDFGLTLLRQLNHSLGQGGRITISATSRGLRIQRATAAPAREVIVRDVGEQAPSQDASNASGGTARGTERRLSLRGVAFLLLYCWLFSAGATNCLAGLFTAEGTSQHILTLAGGILWLVMITIVLIVHSSVTSVPNQQPYRCAMLAMRFTLGMACVLQTLIFIRWWHHLHHPAGIFDR